MLLGFAVVLFTLPYILVGVFAFINPPTSLYMISKRLSGQKLHQEWVDLEKVSSHLIRAVIASEDNRFCTHGGVDWEVLTSLYNRLQENGKASRGGSTITMQTVKNMFLWPGRSYVRKALEIPLALWADLVWSKPRLMEIYLNIVEMDEGVFGIKAASEHYFKKPPGTLSKVEAVRLATTIPNPIRRNPAQIGVYHRNISRIIYKRLNGFEPYTKCVFAKTHG